MSAMAGKARDDARLKAERLTRTPKGDVDASGWREPLGENAQVQTGPRPISRRQFKRGGKVEGEKAKKHAGRKPRAAGGVTSSVPAGSVRTGGMTTGGTMGAEATCSGAVRAGGLATAGTSELLRPAKKMTTKSPTNAAPPSMARNIRRVLPRPAASRSQSRGERCVTTEGTPPSVGWVVGLARFPLRFVWVKA